jgi:hypothetical protein
MKPKRARMKPGVNRLTDARVWVGVRGKGVAHNKKWHWSAKKIALLKMRRTSYRNVILDTGE